jgi:CheY-like chemotaxis protein/HPt (histidine-containing phosphotransfer) domain-containing protein
VLLAEDNETNREYVRAMLERAGCRVATALNGRAAVQRAVHEPFDLVLMDIQMPELDGLAAARAIRDALGERTPPIIALTAHALPDDERRSRAAGMALHLIKPLVPEDLEAALHEVLGPAAADGRAATAEVGSSAGVAASAQGSCAGSADAGAVVDFAAGLGRAGGDAALYRQVLASFHADHHRDPAALRTAIHIGERETARRIVHTLKGVAALIGARGLHRHAVRALDALAGDEWTGPTGAVADALEAVLARLDAVVPGAADT